MVIDLILDRKAGEFKYNAKKAYDYIRTEEECFDFIENGINISGAMDHGTEEDVKKQLCNYILKNDYNPEICEYINSVNWLDDDSVTRDDVRKLAQNFLDTADKYAKHVSDYIDGDQSDSAAWGYYVVKQAEQKFIDAVNELEGYHAYDACLNYELAEAFLPAA